MQKQWFDMNVRCAARCH